MRFNSFGFSLMTTVLGSVLCGYPFLCAAAASQQDSPSWNKTIPKETPPRPTRPTRPRPAPHRPMAVQRPAARAAAPLLSIQYRIFKVNQNNSQVEVSPLTVFNKGDHVRIGVKANQDVFLYVIHQRAPNQTGKIYVPDSQINSGQNFLMRDHEFVVPSGCPPGTPAQACSYEVDANAGQEQFTMIFSRNPSINLSDDQAEVSSEIKPQTLVKFINASNQKLDTQGRGDSIFALRINNLNPTANEKIIVRYGLNKRGS